MRFHEPAVTIAAEQISLKRFLSHGVSDEELVELAVTAYREACPNRSRREPRNARQSHRERLLADDGVGPQ